MSNSYRDLIAWQQAVDLVTYVYEMTASFPPSERFGLISQMQRAAVSVACNIGEGQGRNSPRQFHLFLGNARGSLIELETQLFICTNLGYITAEKRNEALNRTNRVMRLVNGLMNSLVAEEGSESLAATAAGRATKN